jgi:hypothetical protein
MNVDCNRFQLHLLRIQITIKLLDFYSSKLSVKHYIPKLTILNCIVHPYPYLYNVNKINIFRILNVLFMQKTFRINDH